MTAPLPPGLPELLASPGTNRSLYFYRAYDGYAEDFGKPGATKRDRFLRGFKNGFGSSMPRELEPFLERRKATLARLSATRLTLHSTQPLVLGLGLPHPTETALLLDRLTGCPYVPGSSLKGVLRRAARLVAADELPVDEPADAAAYWREHLDPIFGPPIGEGATPATGRAVFYDAFPTKWPELEVDVLTPHHGSYYGDPSNPPGDWEEPVPVPFLVVAPNTPFCFSFGPARARRLEEEDVAALRSLLLAALDWLGIGAKTASQGYGTFSRDGRSPGAVTVLPITTPSTNRQTGRKPWQEPPPPPPPRPRKVKEPTTWENVELTLERGKATVYRGNKQKAQCDPEDLPPEVRKALKKKKVLKVVAEVEPGLGKTRRLVGVRIVEE